MRINTRNIANWNNAKKTKNVRVKPLACLLVDKSVTNKFLVDTLEGNQTTGDGVVICVGETGDAWQEMPNKLLQKYDVIEIDKDGWLTCKPKPENYVFAVQITDDLLQEMFPGETDRKTFTIIGQRGETIGTEKNVQSGEVGDYICQNNNDMSDVWIVKRKIFNNTYKVS